ncbi:MAG TPA: protease HtpX, partial [Tistrella mobilis]|nr:protease HtpX [Tistrella mobilis]
ADRVARLRAMTVGTAPAGAPAGFARGPRRGPWG